MPGPQAVGATAVGRAEVRKSLDRLDYHLARGAKGAKGVRREVNLLDALHRQTVRNSSIAVGRPYAAKPRLSFGGKAAHALKSGDTRRIGRVKSSILADFSSDGLQPARDWAATATGWIWVSNGSACPTCLGKHGQKYRGQFVPSHPSCLCVPETIEQAKSNGVTPLSDSQLTSIARQYGDPRYYKKLNEFENGLIGRNELIGVENVNGQSRGIEAYRKHLAKQEVTPLGSGGTPAPTGFPSTPPAPKPTPKPEVPKPKPKDIHPAIDGIDEYSVKQLESILRQGLDDKFYDTTLVRKQISERIALIEKENANIGWMRGVENERLREMLRLTDPESKLRRDSIRKELTRRSRLDDAKLDFTGLSREELRAKRLELRRNGLSTEARLALDEAEQLLIKREAAEKAARIAEGAKDQLGKPRPQTLYQRQAQWKKDGYPRATEPSRSAVTEEIESWIQANHRVRLGKATNAERMADMERMTSFTDDIAEEYAKAKTAKAKIEVLEREAKKRWPLTDDGAETLFDFGGVHPEVARANLDNLFRMAEKFPRPAERLRYIGSQSDPYKMWAANLQSAHRASYTNARNRLFSSQNPRAWTGKKGVYAYVNGGSQVDTMMAFNPAMGFKKADDMLAHMRSDIAGGFHPVGTDTLTSVLTHEYGHLVDKWMDDILKVIRDDVDDLAKANKMRAYEDLRSGATSGSRYGEKNHHEQWAEFFSDRMENGNFGDETWKAFEEMWKSNSGVV